MYQVPFYIYGAKRPCGTNRFAYAATDATGCIYNGYLGRIIVFRVFYHHLNGSIRAMACTVSAHDAVCVDQTVLLIHTACPIWIDDFSARVIGRIAPVGHTCEHRVHSGRQAPSANCISGCINVDNPLDGCNT